MEFVTLEDGSEGLIIINKSFDNKLSYKFLDPFLPSDTIDITKDINDSKKIIITKSNRKFSIIENNVWTADGLNKDTFQQILNKTIYHSNIYTLSIFKKIENMLNDMIKSDTSHTTNNNKVTILADGTIFRFILKVKDSGRARLFGECLQNNEWKKTQNSVSFKYKIFSYKKLDNQDLALITRKGILIYTITEDFLGLRYFWNNEDWNEKFGFEDNITDFDNYCKPFIKEILDDKFKLSLPSPNFKTIFEKIKKEQYRKHKNTEYKKYEKYFLSIINNPVEFSKFGLEMLEIATNEKDGSFIFIIQSIVDKIIELIDDSENYN